MRHFLPHRRLAFRASKLYAQSGDGTVTTDGDYKIHTFTANDTFTVADSGDFEIIDGLVWYLVVAGGGAGGGYVGGGGGAGGYKSNSAYDHAVTAQAYSITVGAGGVANMGFGVWNGWAVVGTAGSGGNSVFDTITSTGGGGGAHHTSAAGANGGSGGGGASVSLSGGSASPTGQGYAGGIGSNVNSGFSAGGGGGGASEVGEAGSSANGGDGGDGTASSISGGSVTYAGGGGGGTNPIS